MSARLIKLTVPSVRLHQPQGDSRPHAQYEFVLERGSTKTSAFRRWSECRAFAAKATAPATVPAFPSSGTSGLWRSFSNVDLQPPFLETRRAQLQAYFGAFAAASPDLVAAFLRPKPAPLVIEEPEVTGLDNAGALCSKDGGDDDLVSPKTCGSDTRHQPPLALDDFGCPPPQFSPLQLAPQLAAAAKETLGTPPQRPAPLPPGGDAAAGAKEGIKARLFDDVPEAAAREEQASRVEELASSISTGLAKLAQAREDVQKMKGAIKLREASLLVAPEEEERGARPQAAVLLQRVARGGLVRGRMRASAWLWAQCAATHLQRVLKGCLVRKRQQRAAALWENCAATHLQRVVRGWLARRAVRRLGALWRDYRDGRAATHWVATRLQKVVRGGLVRRRKRRAEALWTECAATHLQRVARGALDRQRHQRASA